MMACESAGEVSGPKFMVPRHRRLTLRPERPRWVYSMPLTFSLGSGSAQPGRRPQVRDLGGAVDELIVADAIFVTMAAVPGNAAPKNAAPAEAMLIRGDR